MAATWYADIWQQDSGNLVYWDMGSKIVATWHAGIGQQDGGNFTCWDMGSKTGQLGMLGMLGYR